MSNHIYSTLKASSGYRAVMPSPWFRMAGHSGAGRQKPAEGVHDPPLVVGLLLDLSSISGTAGNQLLLLSTDVCVLTKDKTDIMKRAIEKRTGISKENVIISAVHTHSGPSGLDSSYLAPPDDASGYLEQTAAAMAELADSLTGELKEVSASFKQVPIEGYFGNRSCPERQADTTATLIHFCTLDGTVTAALLNLNCHSTVVGQETMLSTSDLLGAVRQKLFEKLGCMPYTFSGAAADISNRAFRQGNDFSELERTADGVFQQLWDGGRWQSLDISAFSKRDFFHSIWYDNTRFFPNYRTEIDSIEAILKSQSLSSDARRLKESELLNAKRKLAIDQVDIQVHTRVFHLGRLLLIAFPGELASSFGTELAQKNKDLLTLIIGYADDYQGYFMESHMYGKCYETVASDVPKGESERLIEKLGEIL